MEVAMNQLRRWALAVLALTGCSMEQESVGAQEVPEPSVVALDHGVPLEHLGIELALPSGLEVQRPGVMDMISVIQIVDPSTSARVEIYAERLPDNLSREAWRELQRQLVPSDYLKELSSRPAVVARRAATFRELSSHAGTIWETEIWVGHVVYRISALHGPQMEPLYQRVLDGITLTGADRMPANLLPSLDGPAAAASEPGGPSASAFPTLKFPFNGSATINCAYYADDANCHENSRIALDFSLSYEAVRAAHPGTVYKYSEACGGKIMRITDSSDTTYRTQYVHLDRYFTTGSSVTRGEYIARSGNTGSCTTGAHLHFELERSGSNIKPEPMCSKSGFLRGQTHSDCWSSSEEFASDVATTLTITSAAVNLKVCASNLPGKTVYVSMWRNGDPERSWRYTKAASTTCVTFSDMDGAGDVLANTYYYTVAALADVPADLASQQKTSCLSATGNKLACDRVIY
jgi:murein DD-endopeptidase MepM/ murein hydrolase activator NlpD